MTRVKKKSSKIIKSGEKFEFLDLNFSPFNSKHSKHTLIITFEYRYKFDVYCHDQINGFKLMKMICENGDKSSHCCFENMSLEKQIFSFNKKKKLSSQKLIEIIFKEGLENFNAFQWPQRENVDWMVNLHNSLLFLKNNPWRIKKKHVKSCTIFCWASISSLKLLKKFA